MASAIFHGLKVNVEISVWIALMGLPALMAPMICCCSETENPAPANTDCAAFTTVSFNWCCSSAPLVLSSTTQTRQSVVLPPSNVPSPLIATLQ